MDFGRLLFVFLYVLFETEAITHTLINFNYARRNRRQSGYRYDKPSISFDLPVANKQPKPVDQTAIAGYSSDQAPSPQFNPGQSPQSGALPNEGYPKVAPPPLGSSSPSSGSSPPQTGGEGYPSRADSKPSSGYSPPQPKATPPRELYERPSLLKPDPPAAQVAPKPEAPYTPPKVEGSTKGPPYLPPKPPSDSYTPNEAPMVIVVPDIPQSIESSTPGGKYLPPIPSNKEAPSPPGPPKEKYVPPISNDLPAPSSGYSAPTPQPFALPENPSKAYIAPSSGAGNEGGSPSISTPASTYLPPFQ